VFATSVAITSLDDPRMEVLDQPQWREVGTKGISQLGKVVRMMVANLVGARELITRKSLRIVGPDKEFQYVSHLRTRAQINYAQL